MFLFITQIHRDYNFFFLAFEYVICTIFFFTITNKISRDVDLFDVNEKLNLIQIRRLCTCTDLQGKKEPNLMSLPFFTSCVWI